MSASGKIYIIVTDKVPSQMTMKEDGTDVTAASGGEEGGGKSSGSKAMLAAWAMCQIRDLTKQTATQAVMYTLGNIGNFTGDYIMQTKVNTALSNLSGLKNIASTGLAGAAVGAQSGGVYGAIIGAAVGLTVGTAKETIGSAYEIYSRTIENKKTNYQIEQLRARSGLNSLRDGSRGTEN